MQSYFLVYPTSPDWQAVKWCAVAPDIAPKVTLGSLETLAQLAQATPIIALLPGSWVSIFRVELPRARAAMIKKALPFLLEENLAEDFEAVHIALPVQYRAAEMTPVAVVSKVRMQTLSAAFKAAQLNLQHAFPDWMCLPLFDGTWTIHLDETNAYVRQEACVGFSIQKDLLMPMLNLALTQTEHAPQALHIYHLPLAATDMEEQLSTLSVPLAYEAVQEDAMLLWTRSLVLPAPLNLLQNEFYIKPKMSAVGRLWRMAGGVLAAIVLAQLLQASLEYHYLKAQYDSVHAQTLALYTQVFPDATDTLGARQKLEQSLGGAQVSSGENPLFAYLMDITAPLLNTPDVELKQLALQNTNLRLEVVVKDFATLSALESALTAQGLSVKQDSASLEENHVLAQLQISRGGQ